ncbi:ribosomal RNA small subunit methyltransferase NEP1 isoform 5 [Mus musculus]|uniref:ribosomal RNA small subunit methyltransferase NEP1 isoform 5 n=1 Tax=Mus musculus TaxID=10090 RepID=UPI0020CD062E|nr:ribosomal RNA small subunit methyltransferase NEP1 isoform 5 [Mus musculus]
MSAASGGFQPRERRFSVQEQDWETTPPKKLRLGAGSKCGGRRLIVVLEGASLETVKSLLMLMDSPLNRAGLLQVYIHTQKNVLIEVNPQTRIPRTFDRFCGLMVQLLHKLSVRAADGPQKLLKVSVEYTEKMVSISNYPLSAALTCAKVTTAFEEVWGVI